MNRGWTPENHVSMTDAGIVIKIRLHMNTLLTLRTTFEEDRLCFHGQHEEFGPFEIKFEIPSGYNPVDLKTSFSKGILRIEIPPGKKTSFLSEFPKTMLIYCNGCGKHFDIVINSKGSHDYTCPACGKVQAFDLEALVKQVMEQCKNMSGKKRRRR